MTVDITQVRAPGLLRRLAAILYDAALLIGVLMVAVTLLVIPYALLIGEPFPHEDPVHRLALQGYLLLVIGSFFTFFWARGGQTLGMRAWRIRVLRDDGEALTWRDAWRRFFTAILALAPLGLGLFWMLFDREGLAWHDRLSNTRLVMLAKPRRRRSTDPPQEPEGAQQEQERR